MVADESNDSTPPAVFIAMLLPTATISVVQLFRALLFSTIAIVLQLLQFISVTPGALYVTVAFVASSPKF